MSLQRVTEPVLLDLHVMPPACKLIQNRSDVTKEPGQL